GLSWTEIDNLSNIDASEKIHVREPRIVGTPFSPNPARTTNTDAFIVAWGTEVNQFEHIAARTLDLDIFITRTQDFGETYSPVQLLSEPRAAGAEVGNLESQFRITPEGDRVDAVWMSEDRFTGV